MKTQNTYTFGDYLSKIPHALVFEYLLKTGTIERTIFSSATLHETVKKYGSSEEVLKRFNVLCSKDKQLCACAYFFGAKGVYHSPIENFGTSLLSSFLVYATQDAERNWYFVGFDEFDEILKPYLIAELTKLYEENTQKNSTSDTLLTPNAAISNCILFLGIVISGEIKMSRFGKLTKTSETALLRLLQLPEEASDLSTLLPPLIIDYCESRNLVCAQNGSFSLNLPNTYDWLHKSAEILREDFTTFLFSQYQNFRHSYLTHLCKSSHNIFIPEEFVPESVTMGFHSACIGLASAHFFDISINKTGIGLHFTPVQKKECESLEKVNSIIVMGDFGAIIPPDINQIILFNFLSLACVTSFDRIYKAKISRQVVFESLSLGILEKELLTTLAHCNAPLNVVTTVKEWIREFNRVALCPDPVLIINDDSIARQILAYEPIARYLTPIPSHLAFRVNPLRLDYLRETLGKLGFDPRTPHLGKPETDDEINYTHLESFLEKKLSVPITTFSTQAEPRAPRTVTSGKYSTILKELDIHEMYHVIDYAIVTNEKIIIEYTGSDLIRKGTYTIIPQSIVRGSNPIVTASDSALKWVKQFYLKNIAKIGVGS